MLGTLPRLNHSERVVRLANLRDDIAALEALGLDRASASAAEMLELLRTRAAPGGEEKLIDASFLPWNKFGPPYGPRPTRFSDGHWPVCYTARDRDTAVDEIRYHRGRDLWTLPSVKHLFYQLIELEYSGTTIDLQTQATVWPELVDPNPSTAYPFCQQLGRAASVEKISGFLTISARRTAGVNVPVFRREALAMPTIKSFASFTLDPSGGTIEVSWS